jgi:hypothetical protein
MSFKQFHTAVLCSGRAATGFAIASAILALSSLRTNAVSEAISKGIPTIQYEIASGFAHRNDIDCFALLKKGLAMIFSNEGEAVPAVRFAHRRPPHPSRIPPTIVGGYSH